MCKQSLDVSCFKSNKKRKDSLQSQCIECQREYRRQHYLENKQKYVDKSCDYKKEFMRWWKEYKKRFKCEECGEDHPACIDFHHHEDNKEKSVSEFVKNVCKEKVLKEIAKCTPLCSNCHRKRHWQE